MKPFRGSTRIIWRCLTLPFLSVALVFSQSQIEKTICLTPFGMEWETLNECKAHLLGLAKREAAAELFGETIQSITEVHNFALTQDSIKVVSAGFIRIKGDPNYSSGNSLGEVCINIKAFVTEEDMAKLRPQEVERKVCIADPQLTLGEVRQKAETQARIQAVKDFEPGLENQEDQDVLSLLHEATIRKAGFLEQTEVYCATIRGKVYPLEILVTLNRPESSKKMSKKDKADEGQELLKKITSSTWTFSSTTNPIARGLSFLPDGVISGYHHPNETSWRFENGVFSFIKSDGTPSCHFTSVHERNNKLIMMGPFIGNPTNYRHILTEE